MKLINLKEIIQRENLDEKELAKNIFPNNKYPVLALRRVVSGEAHLDILQLNRLATYLNIDIVEFFKREKWALETNTNNIFIYKKDAYRVELDMDKGVTKIFSENSLFHESILHSRHIVLSEYFKNIDTIIENYKNKQNEN